MTSNFTPEELVAEPKTREKVLSRISEFMTIFDFSDARDFRTHILRHATVERVKRQIEEDFGRLELKHVNLKELLYDSDS